MIELQEIFEVHYGTNLELNKLTKDDKGINFVSRTSKNNGISCRVKKLANIKPITAGVLSVAGGGSVLETFLQEEPFYSGRDLYYLIPRIKLSKSQKLYYCMCIKANKYRYNYGRQANKTLKFLRIPSPSDIPDWVNNFNLKDYNSATDSLIDLISPNLAANNWKGFKYSDLFKIKKGKRLTKTNMAVGNTPFIGAIEYNNGCRQYIKRSPLHESNTITVNYNGSVAEAFYQPVGFWASDDVNVLYPKFEMNKYHAMFLCCLIRAEKYRYNYGRKWHLERMKESVIKLPVDSSDEPDWDFMENYIKSLPYSSSI